MKGTLVLCLTAALLLSTVHRAPAPILEESPTPAPEQSAKPRAKHSAKPVASETPKVQTKRNPFDGTWTGTIPRFNDERVLDIAKGGTVVRGRSSRVGAFTWPATCDGSTMKWKAVGGCDWILIPNPDGKTAVVTANCAGVFGIGAGSWSAVFRRTSP